MVEPIVRIAHLVREIKFCDRQIGRLNATSALRHDHIAPVLTGSPPPVQILLRMLSSGTGSQGLRT